MTVHPRTKTPRPPSDVASLVQKAREALTALFVEVADGKPNDRSDSVDVVAWSTARLGIDVLADLALASDDPRALDRRQLVEVVGRLRRGRALVQALDLTRDYVARVRAVPEVGRAKHGKRGGPLPSTGEAVERMVTRIRERLAKEYVAELRDLDLDEVGQRVVAASVIAVELAGDGLPKPPTPRGPETILARVLVLHRDGAIHQKMVGRLRAVISVAVRRHLDKLARVDAE